MKAETLREKELFDTMDKLYPHNERGFTPALLRDIEAIRNNDQGSSSFNASMIKARNIEYVLAIEKYVRSEEA